MVFDAAWVQRARLASGIILMLFVLTHYLNHALGLISLDVLEAGRRWFLALWRNPLGTLLLYASLLVHMSLALWALYERRSLRLRGVDWLQLGLGFAIPLFLTLHILGTRGANSFFGTDDDYVYTLAVLFLILPKLGAKQVLLILIVWLHGAIGLHMWLRLKPWYRPLQWLWYALALLIPAIALAGIWVAVRDLSHAAAAPDWIERELAQRSAPAADQAQLIYDIESGVLIGLGLALALTLLLRPLRDWLRWRLGNVRITYPDGKRVTVPRGLTILEASQQAAIPHASVCGGRGRCSTCRVRIGQGLESLPRPNAEELRVLKRVGAAENVRLACQTRPVTDCVATPLLPTATGPASVGPERGYRHGQEREVTVLFADLRDFTALSEEKLPFDVVFLLNRYFASMGHAIEAAGGRVDKFIGDGVMALFGLEGSPEAGARAALRAARNMATELERLNKGLEHELSQPLRIGIGLHRGPAIVGEMGYGAARGVTAVGDTVNTASRLEAMTKEFGVQLVLSQSVAESAGIEATFERKEIAIRGRSRPLQVYLVPEAGALPAPRD